MKKLALTAVFAIVLGSSAFAQGNLKTLNEPSATTPDCKTVEVSRPNVTAPSFQVRIGIQSIEIKGNTMAAMIKACNPNVAGLQVQALADNGADVRMVSTVGDVGVAKIALPISLTQSKMEGVVCLKTPAPDGSKHAKYSAQWSGQLPEKIALTKLDTYDKAAADRGCGALSPAS